MQVHDDAGNNSVSVERRSDSASDQVLDTVMRVTTPENISFQYQLAGPFRRIFAYFIDVTVSIVGYFVIVLLLYLLFIFVMSPLAAMIGGTAILNAIAEFIVGLIFIGYFIVYWFYGAVMETYFNGQTYGKRWTRMRVLSSNGYSIDGVQATLRNFFRLLDVFPLASYTAVFQLDQQTQGGFPTCMFALVVMAISQRFQRLGDLVAGTVVISEVTTRKPDLAEFTDQRVPHLAELIPTSYVVPPGMARAIADYVDKRRFLSHQRCVEIAGHLAQPLIHKFNLMPDTDYDLFLCALYYKTFIALEAGGDGLDAPLATPGGMTARVPINPSGLPASEIPVATVAGASTTSLSEGDAS